MPFDLVCCMKYVVQAMKVLRNLVHAETNARCPKMLRPLVLALFSIVYTVSSFLIHTFITYKNITYCMKVSGFVIKIITKLRLVMNILTQKPQGNIDIPEFLNLVAPL